MSRSITDIINAWYASTDEVNRLGRDLLASGYLKDHNVTADYTEAEALLDFMEKPHYWNRVHAWWVANEWPDDAESWERGQATGWEIK